MVHNKWWSQYSIDVFSSFWLLTFGFTNFFIEFWIRIVQKCSSVYSRTILRKSFWVKSAKCFMCSTIYNWQYPRSRNSKIPTILENKAKQEIFEIVKKWRKSNLYHYFASKTLKSRWKTRKSRKWSNSRKWRKLKKLIYVITWSVLH
jgi:hypothetical protein